MILCVIYYRCVLKEKPLQIIIINKCEKREDCYWLFRWLEKMREKEYIKNVCIMRMHEMHLSLQFNSRFVSMILLLYGNIFSFIAWTLVLASLFFLSHFRKHKYFTHRSVCSVALSLCALLFIFCFSFSSSHHHHRHRCSRYRLNCH